MIAKTKGGTGIQPNAAIPEVAPEIDYWAIQAGDGARLDGKQPATLKDATGNVVDVRQLRAEAVARRATEEAVKSAAMIPLTTGVTVAGEKVDVSLSNATTTTTTNASTSSVPSSSSQPRKTRIGSKYSRLKGSSAAFNGSANQMHDK